MSAANVTSTLDPAHPATANRKSQILSIRLLVRVGTILGLACLLVSTFYSASSVAITHKVNKKNLVSEPRMQTSEAFVKIFRGDSRSLREPIKPFLLASPQASDEMVQTYASDCLTPQTVFTVGDTVCVKAPGVPLNDFFPRRLLWACCREIGTLIFKGRFISSSSISGKLIFITNTSEEESPYGFHSWVGVFAATRIPDDKKQ